MRVKPTPSCSAVSDQPPMMSPEGLVRAKRISAAHGHQHPQQPFRKTPHDEGIEYIGAIFVEKRPPRSIERVHLLPAAHVHRHRHGQQRHADEHHREHLPHRHGMHRPHIAILKIEQRRTDDRPHDDHRMQADEPPFEEIFERHAVPAVVVGIADDESRKGEEEIDGQVAVVEQLVEMARGVRFAEVEDHDQQRSDAAQAVQNIVMGFAVGIGGRGERSLRHRSSFFGIQK